MNTKNKIEKYCKEKKYCSVIRKLDYIKEKEKGYIMAFSDKLLLLYITLDFLPRSCTAFPMEHIRTVKRSRIHQYNDKIIEWEGVKDTIKLSAPVDVSSFQALFVSLKKAGKYVIVECELYGRFVIGSIEKASSTAVFIRYFDPQGYVDDYLTRVPFKEISRVSFDDHYVDTFRKYLRKREGKAPINKDDKDTDD